MNPPEIAMVAVYVVLPPWITVWEAGAEEIVKFGPAVITTCAAAV